MGVRCHSDPALGHYTYVDPPKVVAVNNPSPAITDPGNLFDEKLMKVVQGIFALYFL